MRNHPYVWERILNRKARAVWRDYASRQRLDAVQERIAGDLERNGIALIHFSELFPGSSLFDELESYGHRLLVKDHIQKEIADTERGNVNAKDDLIIHMLGGYSGLMPELVPGDPYLRFNLDGRILAIAGSYLGVAPRFRMFSLHSTALVPEGSGARFSQRWHRDPDDRKIVKVFLYVNDVLDIGTGPFMYVRGSHDGGQWRDPYPQLFPVGSYPPNGAVEKLIPAADIMRCFGRKGTIIFCDTSGFHKGGYSTKKRRLMYAGTFVTDASVQDIKYWIHKKADISILHPLARFALGRAGYDNQ